MKIFRNLSICRFECVVPVLAALMAIPTIVPQSRATGVIGGGDCIGQSLPHNCSNLGNNGDECAGGWQSAVVAKNGNFEKEMKAEKWCSGCDSEVTQFDLKSGCKSANPIGEYEISY